MYLRKFLKIDLSFKSSSEGCDEDLNLQWFVYVRIVYLYSAKQNNFAVYSVITLECK